MRIIKAEDVLLTYMVEKPNSWSEYLPSVIAGNVQGISIEGEPL
jgi:hypothetical protein